MSAGYREGDRVCTVSRLGSRFAAVRTSEWTFYFAVWTGSVYVARRRKRDGALTWRLEGRFGGTRTGNTPSQSFIAELKAAAEHPWLDGVRHGHVAHEPADVLYRRWLREEAWSDLCKGYGGV